MNGKRTVYCHFSFKRPKDRPGMGYFAVAFYNDKAGKQLTAYRVVEKKLWKDQQFITAIQSYEFALSMIHEWQGIMSSKGIGNVMLVTDNSTLAGWIENPRKNKKYTEYMGKATEKYRIGAPMEINIGVGLCDVVAHEKAYKMCNKDRVTAGYSLEDKKNSKVIDIAKDKYSSVYDMLAEEEEE